MKKLETKVCMFVYNNCTKDARVLKEAASLVNCGCKVKIIAVDDGKGALEYEIRDGIEIIRVEKNPIHLRLLKGGFIRSLFTSKEKNKLKRLREEYIASIKIENGDQTTSKSELLLIDLSAKELVLKARKELRNKPFRFLLFRWIPYLGVAFFKCYKRLFYSLLIFPLKKLFMLVHKPLCFHDFYKRSLQLNKEEPSDIYHGHDLHTVPTAFKTAKRTRAKVVYDAHELYTEMSVLKPLEKRMYTFIERKYAPKVDALITVNESIAKELLTRYNLKDSPYIIFNCPQFSGNVKSTNDDVLRRKLNISADTKIVLYQGGYSLNRGLFNLIESAEHIKEGVIVFMGWGNIEADLKFEVKKRGLEKKVLFTPGVPQNELLDHSKSADIGVIPYQFIGLNNYYTSPNKLFEYLGANVPIAGSNFPELKRVINTYNVGATFDPESPKSIAQAINQILKNDEYRGKLKENTKLASRNFTWEKEEKKLHHIYDQLVNA